MTNNDKKNNGFRYNYFIFHNKTGFIGHSSCVESEVSRSLKENIVTHLRQTNEQSKYFIGELKDEGTIQELSMIAWGYDDNCNWYEKNSWMYAWAKAFNRNGFKLLNSYMSDEVILLGKAIDKYETIEPKDVDILFSENVICWENKEKIFTEKNCINKLPMFEWAKHAKPNGVFIGVDNSELDIKFDELSPKIEPEIISLKNDLWTFGLVDHKIMNQVGSFDLTLKHKAWGEMLSLKCYFEDDEGTKVWCKAYRNLDGITYTTKNGDIDFKSVGKDTRWRCVFEKSPKSDYPSWISAELITT